MTSGAGATGSSTCSIRCRSAPRSEAKLKKVAYALTLRQAERHKGEFPQSWVQGEGMERAATLFDKDWQRMVSDYCYQRAHLRHLRTMNVSESPFAVLRLRMDAAKQFNKVANATTVLRKILLVDETQFQTLNAPELL